MQLSVLGFLSNTTQIELFIQTTRSSFAQISLAISSGHVAYTNIYTACHQNNQWKADADRYNHNHQVGKLFVGWCTVAD